MRRKHGGDHDPDSRVLYVLERGSEIGPIASLPHQIGRTHMAHMAHLWFHLVLRLSDISESTTQWDGSKQQMGTSSGDM